MTHQKGCRENTDEYHPQVAIQQDHQWDTRCWGIGYQGYLVWQGGSSRWGTSARPGDLKMRKHHHNIRGQFVDHARGQCQENIMLVQKHTTFASGKYHDLPYFIWWIQWRKTYIKLRWLTQHFPEHEFKQIRKFKHHTCIQSIWRVRSSIVEI